MGVNLNHEGALPTLLWKQAQNTMAAVELQSSPVEETKHESLGTVFRPHLRLESSPFDQEHVTSRAARQVSFSKPGRRAQVVSERSPEKVNNSRQTSSCSRCHCFTGNVCIFDCGITFATATLCVPMSSSSEDPPFCTAPLKRTTKRDWEF